MKPHSVRHCARCPGGTKLSRLYERVYDPMGKEVDTTSKAEGDKCYDKGKKKIY